MDKLFAAFGKIALVLLVFASVGAGAYYFGQKSFYPISSPSPSPTPKESPAPSPSATPISTKTVEGGLPKSAGLVFDQYTFEVPLDWTVSKDTSSPDYEKLTLTKGGYQLTIMQGATGGALCLYPGDPDFEGPSSRFTKFVELKTQDGRTLRRSSTDDPPVSGKVGFTVCMKTPQGDFNQPTIYGHMGYSLPVNYDKEKLLEMDTMISSLKKK